jgi:hypothetical protein
LRASSIAEEFASGRRASLLHLGLAETAFASLKKYAAYFFNLGLAETEPKEAAYAAAGVNSKK